MARNTFAKEITLQITHLANDGTGSGSALLANRAIPMRIDVPFTMPGDIVQVSIGKKRSGNYQGNLLEVLSPSPNRLEARCAHFALCGGCLWQHIPYEQQLAVKERSVRELFSAYLTDTSTIYPIIPCTPPWGYRNKMEYSFSTDKGGNRYLGLCIRGGRGKVFQMNECHLVPPWMVDTVKNIQIWWGESGLDAYHHYKNTGSLRTLTLREGLRSNDRMANLTVSGNPDYALNGCQLASLVAFLRESMESTEGQLSLFLTIQHIAKGSPTNFFEMQLYGEDHIRETLYVAPSKDPAAGAAAAPEPFTFTISPAAFFQPNTLQAEKLYSAALQLADFCPEDIVYDLYCGTGTLGICAAKAVKQVIGIELSPEGALDAKTNAANNNLENVTILCGDVGELLAARSGEGNLLPRSAIALVDPPRVGLSAKALSQLVALKPRTIVYISCNPATQAANVAILTSQGYKLDALQPVDQFPHTVHLENIALLRSI